MTWYIAPGYSMRSLRGMVYLAQNQPPKSNRKRRNIWVDPYFRAGAARCLYPAANFMSHNVTLI
jgi:hypothetical protein